MTDAKYVVFGKWSERYVAIFRINSINAHVGCIRNFILILFLENLPTRERLLDAIFLK